VYLVVVVPLHRLSYRRFVMFSLRGFSYEDSGFIRVFWRLLVVQTIRVFSWLRNIYKCPIFFLNKKRHRDDNKKCVILNSAINHRYIYTSCKHKFH